MGLKNKVAIVTGGNSGIGKATAIMFAEEGAKVVIAARDVTRGEEVVSIIRNAGGDAIFVRTDVAKTEDVENMVRKTIDAYGRLDCAVNNAGCVLQGDLSNGTEDDWNWVMGVNLKSIWLCMKAEIPHMVNAGAGAVVNVSSINGLKGYPKMNLYCGSKHGVLGMTKSAAMEFATKNIRINTICPGWIDTPMSAQATSTPEMLAIAKTIIPMGRAGKPEELASAAVFLCSDRASYITGITLGVDGGGSQH